MQTIFSNEEKQLFHTIVEQNLVHARFLNTLSLMELCGAQRLSSLSSPFKNKTFFLEHVAEEYRHAYFLRRLACKIASNDIDSFDHDNVYCKRVSRAYIKNIDRHVSLLLHTFRLSSLTADSPLPYLLTTFIIERRALPFYQFYQSILDEHSINISVKSIIKEEKDHLAAMEYALKQEELPSLLLEACDKIETTLWTKWITHLKKAIDYQ